MAGLPTPYYDDGTVVIYNADCREVLPLLPAPDLVLTDPPYGVSERTDRKAKGRGNAAECNDFPPVYGDDEPFDPAHLLAYPRVILFGANYYADKLPTAASWVVWDKLDGLSTSKRTVGFDDNADCELAWSNCGGPARILAERWKGMVKDTERGDRRVHPTQKPVRLMERLIEWRTEPGDLVLDPYMGSGTTLRAAVNRGRRAIGIEISEDYCAVAVERLGQLTMGIA